MATPVWTTNIPLATDAPAYSQGQILSNNQALATYMAIDHYMFDDATAAFRGKHRIVHLEPQASAVTAASEAAIYYDTSGNLKYQKPSDALPDNVFTVNAWYQGYMGTAGLHTIASYNVSSITFSGTNATVNFTNTLNSTNYAILGNGSRNITSAAIGNGVVFNSASGPGSASSCPVAFLVSGAPASSTTSGQGIIFFNFIVWGA